MNTPLINIITRFSREKGMVRALQSLNEQTYDNVKHYITYETVEGLEFLKSLEYKYPTKFIKVPKYTKIDNLWLYGEHHGLDTDYLNWDWGKWDVKVVLGDEVPPRKEIPCTKKRFHGNGKWSETLPHSHRVKSRHAPYNFYCKLAEAYIDEGWVGYLDDDDVYTNHHSLSLLTDQIKKTNEDTLQVFRISIKTNDGGNIKPPNRYMDHLLTGQPLVIYEIGGACVCFHSKWKEYTQWGHWSGDDYRTISVLDKVIPNRNIINKILYNALPYQEQE